MQKAGFSNDNETLICKNSRLRNNNSISQKELAELILKGLSKENTREATEYFIENIYETFYVCALGAGIVGKFGSAHKAMKIVELEKIKYYYSQKNELCSCPLSYLNIVSSLLGIDFHLAETINKAHILTRSAAKVVEKLKKENF